MRCVSAIWVLYELGETCILQLDIGELCTGRSRGCGLTSVFGHVQGQAFAADGWRPCRSRGSFEDAETAGFAVTLHDAHYTQDVCASAFSIKP
jgi:hypothetical protein